MSMNAISSKDVETGGKGLNSIERCFHAVSVVDNSPENSRMQFRSSFNFKRQKSASEIYARLTNFLRALARHTSRSREIGCQRQKLRADIFREKIISLPLGSLAPWNAEFYSTTAWVPVRPFLIFDSFSAEFSRCIKPAWSSHDESVAFFRFCGTVAS